MHSIQLGPDPHFYSGPKDQTCWVFKSDQGCRRARQWVRWSWPWPWNLQPEGCLRQSRLMAECLRAAGKPAICLAWQQPGHGSNGQCCLLNSLYVPYPYSTYILSYCSNTNSKIVNNQLKSTLDGDYIHVWHEAVSAAWVQEIIEFVPSLAPSMLTAGENFAQDPIAARARLQS